MMSSRPQCRRCGAEILWVRCEKADGTLGKNLPLELVEPGDPEGRIVIVEGRFCRVLRDHAAAVALSMIRDTADTFYRLHRCGDEGEEA